MRDFVLPSRSVVSDVSSLINFLARIGYAAKGAVYALIGVTALLTAINKHPQTEDFDGVLRELFSQPFGSLLLLILTAGLLAYALWCLVQALMDTEKKGSGFAGVIIRCFYAGVGVVYLGITWSAMKLLFGWGLVPRGDRPQQEWTASFLATVPFGNWVVAIIGLGFIAFCFSELRRAYGSKFQILKGDPHDEIEDKIGTVIGRIGITARAIVFAIIGSFLVRAGYYFDPSEVHGISGVLDVWIQKPYGPWFLTTLAFGLIAYGLYMFFLSWRRRLDPI